MVMSDSGRSATRYSIRGGDEGKARLDVLAAALRPTTTALLDRVGVAPGGLCLDLGCGGGHVTRELARLAGPSGRAIGIDLDPRVVELARQDAAADGVTNVEFRVGNVMELDDDEFDIVFARLLVCHLPDPAQFLAAVAARLRPGGVIIMEEPEFSACFSWPPSQAYDSCMALQSEAIRARGGDPDIGPKLPSMFLDLGVRDVAVHVFQPAFLDAPFKDIPHVSLEKMADAIVGEGLATAEGLRVLTEQVRLFASDNRSLLSYPRFFQVWGRR